MYRRATIPIILTLAVVFTLAAATVAIGAPKQTRTVCQDGVTKEIPAHAKAKGAAEGPCLETPPPPTGPDPAAVQACTDMGGELITDTRCAVKLEGAQIELAQAYLIGTKTVYYEWDGTQFVGVPEDDFVAEKCRSAIFPFGEVPMFYSICAHPIYNPQ